MYFYSHSLLCIFKNFLWNFNFDHGLFRIGLLNLHVSRDLLIFMLWISSVIILWLEKTICVTSIILDLLWFVLWPWIWYVLMSTLQTVDTEVYSVAVVWSDLLLSVGSCWLTLFFKSISLPVFCLVVLTVAAREVLKSSTIIVDFLFFLSVPYWMF